MYKNVIHQIQTEGRVAEGMGYVLQFDDGSVVAVDGGMDYDAEVMLDYLKEIFHGKKPVIDAWILTHAHPDHTYCVRGIGLRHADEIEIKKFIYTFPTEERADLLYCEGNGASNQIRSLEDAIAPFGAEHIKPLRGDKFYFGSAEMEVLFTYHELPIRSEKHPMNLNDTSTVFRITANGQTALFLGDAEYAADEVMIRVHGHNLKSDVCQMAHHGSYGSSKEFYDYVDPEYLFWPSVVPGRIITHVMHVPASYALVSGGKVKDIFLAANGHVACEMPIRARENPYMPEFENTPSKALETEFSIKKAIEIPDIHNPADPAWEQSPLIPVDGYSTAKPEGFSVDARMLWSEDTLYLNVRVGKKAMENDPKQLSSSRTDAVRVYLTEEPVTDRYLLWRYVLDRPGYHHGIRLYPALKEVNGQQVSNSAPDYVESDYFNDKENYRVCAAIKFDFPHKKGDRIGLNLEINGFEEIGGKRTHQMHLIPTYIHWSHPVYKPSSLFFTELTD